MPDTGRFRNSKVYCAEKGNLPTIGYGHLIKKGDSYKVGSTITETEAQTLFKKDSKEIFSKADEYLKSFTLTKDQRNALYDASFNMGPGKMSNYNEDGGKYSGENFFLEYMGGGEGIKKRRYAENLLYSEGLYIHLDVIKNTKTKISAEKIIKDAIAPPPPKEKSTTDTTTEK